MVLYLSVFLSRLTHSRVKANRNIINLAYFHVKGACTAYSSWWLLPYP